MNTGVQFQILLSVQSLWVHDSWTPWRVKDFISVRSGRTTRWYGTQQPMGALKASESTQSLCGLQTFSCTTGNSGELSSEKEKHQSLRMTYLRNMLIGKKHTCNIESSLIMAFGGQFLHSSNWGDPDRVQCPYNFAPLHILTASFAHSARTRSLMGLTKRMWLWAVTAVASTCPPASSSRPARSTSPGSLSTTSSATSSLDHGLTRGGRYNTLFLMFLGHWS